MGRLIYAMNVSLDGFVETPDHSLEWTVVDEEIHAWWNDQLRTLDASLYGRRVYELMAAHWPTADDDPATTDVMREFAAIWNPMPKVVFSHGLQQVEHNSRLVRGDVGEALDGLRHEFTGDLAVAGPDLASQFSRQGLVDEYRLVVHPVVLGAGTPFWPELDRPLRLELVETHRFASGAMYLGYRAARSHR
jgi:dihydrofolate reductase